ncbi:beta-ketoacyl-ACP synthase II [Turicimonas muris]|uniref:3-oxoacyl-[acyl-carrier-protein] synthase 2 n=13 Tax=Turicimonas muris TaxID=1796652 RepID=A0A227KS12_9BURK|nr:beta-ketoacyl-ACP synthase II [Turicimonas muris]ANU65489.1 beta-ketoacyl-[acyl-carrier-protein] synthase II [Burkholderiales bacterium YL45]OXE51300.1 beta-ketoacyl-[acyl-carrier-protein] synthase II [Turicimonas muris]QQQ96636.1 beta-ketoacyl-ACP synthase II [Turicimonas muris]
MRRVVVTGIGMVSPLGNDAKTSWENALAGKSGVSKITQFDASAFGSQIAGEVKGFEVEKYLPAKEARRFDRFIHFGVAAGLMALEDSGLVIDDELALRAGCAIGSGIGGLPEICRNYQMYIDRGARRISPFLITGSIANMVSGQLSIMKNLKGPSVAYSTACTTGLHSIGEAAWMIKRGDADVMIAGGAESTVCVLGVGGFDSMHALSRRNDSPETASRPFDKDRDGFVLGEGAGVVVLEDYESAKKRGAAIYGEILGYGLTADAHHITTPSSDGPRRCMLNAIKQAGVNPDEIDYLNAHGTSTVVGDINETKAIKEAFGDHAKNMVVNSTKSMTGHLLGGAGGIETVFSLLALKNQVSPPTINIFEQDPECDLDYCANTARDMKIRYAMKNSFGFGGTNGSLVLGSV